MKLHLASWVTAATTVILLAGCAPSPSESDKGGVSFDPPASAPSAGDIIGEGTVLQTEGSPALLCLGAVTRSYPPQCSGPQITNWDWQAVEGYQAADDVTWGSYAVQGRWDGTSLTVTVPPVQLALYDRVATPDPFANPANAGDSDQATLDRVSAELQADAAVPPATVVAENGYLFVTVLHDDGSLQRYVDDTYGDRIVIIRSTLRPVES